MHFGAGRVAFGKKFSPGPGFFQDVTMEPGFFQVENTRRLRVFSERIATLHPRAPRNFYALGLHGVAENVSPGLLKMGW